MRVYTVDNHTLNLSATDLEPPFSVDEDGSISIAGGRRAYMEFSRAKKALVDELLSRKVKLQQLISAARRLKRADITPPSGP